MEDVTRCAQCADAAVRPPFGFAGEAAVYCTQRDTEVGPDDGCTFGTPGRPRHAACSYDIDLGGDAAIHREADDDAS